MSAVTFDTLEFVNTLKSAGMPAEQAEAVASAVRKAQDSTEVATKGDMRELETRLIAKIDTLKWMLAFVIASGLLPLIKALF